MSAFTTIYCIGPGAASGSGEGPNPILAQIWRGEGSRQWYEARYFDGERGALGKLRTLVPRGPDDADALLDACLAFFPMAFRACPSLSKVEAELGDARMLDFDLEPENVPPSWPALREEAREAFAALPIWRADVRPLGG